MICVIDNIFFYFGSNLDFVPNVNLSVSLNFVCAIEGLESCITEILRNSVMFNFQRGKMLALGLSTLTTPGPA